MQISVCMIVKNEEKILPRILNCVKNFADEIIIVDTGSTDKTKEVAKKFTNNIFDFVWCDDFSKARNFSFSKATKDFVMWLDADDFIDEKNIQKIIELKNDDADCFFFKYATAFDEENNPTFVFYRERIVRNNFNYIWQGFIHEAIIPFGNIKYYDIVIEHRKVETKSPKRNLKIYQKHKKLGALFDARSQYYYSKELYYNGYYKKCIKELKKFLTMPNKYPPNVTDTYLTLARCFNKTKDYQKAISVIFKYIKSQPPTSELLCELAKSFLLNNQTKQAIFFYNTACLCSFDVKNGGFIEKDYYYLIPYLQLTYLYYKVGDFENAKKFHILSKQQAPKNKAVIFNEKFFENKKG